MKLITLFALILLPVLAQAEKIRVVTEHLAPYQIFDADGKLSGFMTEVVLAIFEVAGDEPDIQVLPWKRAFRIATQEKNVMIYSIAQTPERKDKFHWVGQASEEPLYLWSLASHSYTKSSNISDYKHYRIASLRGSNVATYLRNNDFSFLVELNSEQNILPMLQLNRVDFVSGSYQLVKHRADMANIPMEQLTPVVTIPEVTMSPSIALSINSDPKLVQRMKNAFNKLERSGKLQVIRNKWLGVD
ncbi:MAG: ABC transporter substrate-binding protein [Gammaproteobacteria bacterium]|nr:ABC transporter substrate-binding protein [Gammaproteobacteria bacterium]